MGAGWQTQPRSHPKRVRELQESLPCWRDRFWLTDQIPNKIFDKNKIEVVQTIATYTNQSKLDPLAEMEVIANETVKVVKNILGADASIKEVKTYFSGQKNNILLYLPAVLNIGELLNDSTLDDKTNKMEGPLSSLMQNIGSAFSKPVSDEETKNL